MTTAVNDLNERSELIESIMGTIGVELKKKGHPKNQANTGGPYIPVNDTSYDSLIKQVDKYMETIRTMPLGKPVNGSILQVSAHVPIRSTRKRVITRESISEVPGETRSTRRQVEKS